MFVFDNKATGATLQTEILLTHPTTTLSHLSWITYVINVFLFYYFQKWEYMHTPSSQSKEWKLLEVLRSPKDWLGTGNATE